MMTIEELRSNWLEAEERNMALKTSLERAVKLDAHCAL